MNELTGTWDESHEQTGDYDLFMLVTLKSGAALRIQVEKFTLARSVHGGLAKLAWTAAEDAETVLHYLDVNEVAAVAAEKRPSAASQLADAPLRDLRLLPSVHGPLVQHGITTVGQLLTYRAQDLVDIDGLGNSRIAHISKKLAERGLELRKS